MAILERYHQKVNAPDYDKRKRGNPDNVIEAAARINGGKHCSRCGSLDQPHLHHINENWRDYRPENLQFLCQPCHMYIHHSTKEYHMPSRTPFTAEQKESIRQEVDNLIVKMKQEFSDAGVRTRFTKTDAFKALAEHYGVAVNTIENIYYKKGHYAKDNSMRGSVGFGRPSVMSVEAAYGFYEFCKKAGITIN